MSTETPDQKLAAQKRKAALKAAEDENDRMIAALLVEREGYARYGRDERVAQVDAELERRGHKKAAPAKKAAAPKGRTSRQGKQSTAVAKKASQKAD